MKTLSVCLLMISMFCSGFAGAAPPEVSFEWFNLSTNEIWVTDLVGLPAEASPGRLTPKHSEDQPERSESTFSESVRIKDRLVIKWKDNGKQGWPGGLKQVPLQPPTIPPGTAHEAVFSRKDLGIPAKLSSGKIRFTYLGNDKWRIKLIDE
jgi:hypothetical protein